MLFIILYHLLIHAVSTSHALATELKEIVLSILHIGVVCFVLISGYWGIKFSLAKFLRIFILCSCYSVLLYTVYVLLNPAAFSMKLLLVSVLPIQWWYIPVYFCLYLLSPLLQPALQAASTEKKLLYIVLFGAVSFGLGVFIPDLVNGKNPVNFCFIYCIGDFIRHNLPHKFSLRQTLLAYLLLNLGLLPLIALTNHSHLIRDIFFHKIFFSYNGLGLLLNAGLFFSLFSLLVIKSKLINWVAGSVLPVYLLHENNYLSPYLYGFVKHLQSPAHSWLLFALGLVGSTLAIFVACVAMDKLLRPLITLLENLVVNSKRVKMLDTRLKNILAEQPAVARKN